MDYKRILSDTSGLSGYTAPESYFRRKINQFKSNIFISVVIFVLSIIIIGSVALYLVFVVMKNL